MTAPDLLALSLGLSIAAAALGLTVMRGLERRVADPDLRERAWAAALYVPVLPPLVIGLMLLTPAPTQTIAPAAITPSGPATILIELQAASGLQPADLAHAVSVSVLVLAAALAMLRIGSLGIRLERLRRLIRATTAAAANLQGVVEAAAREVGATVPTVRISASGSEALLAGLHRPVLILPAALADAPDSSTTRAVCAHELAHLKRGDHRALWIEEVLLAIAAVNPLLRIIRDHRAAAREEACDATALAGAENHQRRLYARSLLNAVQATGFQGTAPVLTFNSARRIFVMNRLKAILAPASPASPRARHTAVGLVAAIVGVAGAGSLAVAAQRQPLVVPAPMEVAAPTPTAAARQPEANPVLAEQPAPVPTAVPAPGRIVAEKTASDTVQDSPRPADITNVTWARYPTPAFPELAIRNGVSSGRATLSCTVEADGRTSGCAVVEEDPEGNGFGAAALAAMETARLSPQVMESAASGAAVRFTIRFRLTGDNPPPPHPTPISSGSNS